MTKTIFQKLKEDPQVSLNLLEHNQNFRWFIEQVPEILSPMAEEIATINTVMEAQYRCVDHLLSLLPSKPKYLQGIRQSLSEYEDAKTFFWALGRTEESHLRMTPGLSDSEYEQFQLGLLTIGDLIKDRPAILLAPMLRKKKQ